MILGLYRAFGTIGAPLISIYLSRRLARGKEDPARFGERLGQTERPRPRGPLVWFHAASVGESLSLLPLIERMRKDRPEFTLLITTGTVTSAHLMAERLPDGVIHQFVPVDRPLYVRRFFDHWKPDLVLWSESEFWPNLVSEPAKRNIPLVLINGRVSPRAFKGWQRFPGLIRQLLNNFSLCLGQMSIDVERLRALGATEAHSVGNLKFAVPSLPVDKAELTHLRNQFQGRPLWLAASTHPGEEEILLSVHRSLEKDFPSLLTIIVPRHADRGGSIKALLSGLGAKVARRSAGDDVDKSTEVYIADTMGELGLFYRLADFVFMGKSFVDLGGQNLLEAARLDCAIFYGPYMWNFAEIVERMEEAGATVPVVDGPGLADALRILMKVPEEQARLALAAKAFAEAEADVIDAVMGELDPYLDRVQEMETGRAGT